MLSHGQPQVSQPTYNLRNRILLSSRGTFRTLVDLQNLHLQNHRAPARRRPSTGSLLDQHLSPYVSNMPHLPKPHLMAVSVWAAFMRISSLGLVSLSFSKSTTLVFSADVASSIRQDASTSRSRTWLNSCSFCSFQTIEGMRPLLTMLWAPVGSGKDTKHKQVSPSKAWSKQGYRASCKIGIQQSYLKITLLLGKEPE